MDDELKEKILRWVKKIGPYKKYPYYFVETPEVNEGLDLLLEIADLLQADEAVNSKIKNHGW